MKVTPQAKSSERKMLLEQTVSQCGTAHSKWSPAIGILTGSKSQPQPLRFVDERTEAARRTGSSLGNRGSSSSTESVSASSSICGIEGSGAEG